LSHCFTDIRLSDTDTASSLCCPKVASEYRRQSTRDSRPHCAFPGRFSRKWLLSKCGIFLDGLAGLVCRQIADFLVSHSAAGHRPGGITARRCSAGEPASPFVRPVPVETVS